MKKLIAFTLFLFSHFILKAAVIPHIISPSLNQLTDTVLYIQASVTSEYEIASFTGTVNSTQTTLTYADGYFRGALSLANLPKDTLLLTVTASDAFNNVGIDSVYFIYAPPPKVVINYPLNWSNTYPSVPLKGFCMSSDTCTLTVTIFIDGQAFFSKDFTNAADTVVTINPGTNRYNDGYVQFTATDKWGQASNTRRTIFYNNNPYLREAYQCENKIIDFNFNKILYTDNETGIIEDINTKEKSFIQGAYPDDPANSFLTPYGAIFGKSGAWERVYEWNNDSLYQFGSYHNVHTAGQYATWLGGFNNTNYDLYFRNLSTRTDTLIASNYCIHGGCEDNCLAENGLVAYRNQWHNIDKFANSTTTAVTSDQVNSGRINSNPVTDGKNIVYINQYDFADSPVYIRLNNGFTDIVLSALEAPVYWNERGQRSFYQVNNNYIAYCKKGSSGQIQIWLRDTSGSERQLTFFSNDSYIGFLNPLGDVIFNYGGKMLLLTNGGQLKELGELSGIEQYYYRDSAWYILLGRHLYKLLTDAYITINDGEWTNPSTWQSNAIPPANADVIITNNVVVNANATCNSIRVMPQGSITVSPGILFTVLH